MRMTQLLTVTAVVMIGFGVAFLLMPGPVFQLYGVRLTASGVMLAHVSGAAVTALGALAWTARKLDDGLGQRAALVALAVFFVLKSAVTLLAQLTGVFNALGWTILALDIPLADLYVAALWRAAEAPARARSAGEADPVRAGGLTMR